MASPVLSWPGKELQLELEMEGKDQRKVEEKARKRRESFEMEREQFRKRREQRKKD